MINSDCVYRIQLITVIEYTCFVNPLTKLLKFISLGFLHMYIYIYLRTKKLIIYVLKKYHKIIKRECTRRITDYRIKSISSHRSNVWIAFPKTAPLSLKKFRAKDESEASLREADVQFSLFSLDEQIKFSKSKGSFSQSALRTADPSNRIRRDGERHNTRPLASSQPLSSCLLYILLLSISNAKRPR